MILLLVSKKYYYFKIKNKKMMLVLILKIVYVFFFIVIAPFRCLNISETMTAYNDICIRSLDVDRICTDPDLLNTINKALVEGSFLIVGYLLLLVYTLKHTIQTQKTKTE